MRQSEQITELFSALSLAQGEIRGAKKDVENTFFKSKYADLASVQDVLREPLSKNGLAIIQLPRINDASIEVETILAHKSGQFIAEILSCSLVKKDAQAIGLAITYLRRYSIMAMCGVAAEDDDGNSASGHDDLPKNERARSGTVRDAREEDEQAARYYVTTSKVKFSKIASVSALREWWEKEKLVMADMFSGKDDPLYIDLKSAYAAHGASLAAAEDHKVTTTAEKINDSIPY